MALKHASCVEFNGKGILIIGESGSGKSDLALRLIDAGGILIGDDYVELAVNGNKIVVKPAPHIEGMIEVRGIGVVEVDFKKKCLLHLVLQLTDRTQIERLPEAEFFEYEGVEVPMYKFDPFALSAIPKIKLLVK